MAKIIKSADHGIRGFEKIFIEDPRRAWTIGIFLVIVIVLLVVFWSRIKGLFQSLVNKGGLNADLDEHITSTGETPTLSGVQFNLLANKLYNAMKGVGTDENTVYSCFNQLRNTADMLKLIAVFGTKDGETLDQWIRGDLNSWEINRLNTNLANKGIAYAF